MSAMCFWSFFHTHQFACTLVIPSVFFPDMDNQDISVTERAVDQERDWTTGVGGGGEGSRQDPGGISVKRTEKHSTCS